MAKRTSSFTKQELTDIRASLPATWIKDLAKKNYLADGTIRNIMYGQGVNDEVVFSAIDLAVQHKGLMLSKKELVKTL